MIDLIHTVMEYVDVPLHEAIAMATEVPARAIGLVRRGREESDDSATECTRGAIDSSTIGPVVIGGTKCPSPTSKWNTRHSARSRISTCSPRREKSAAYSDGSTSIVRIQSPQVTTLIFAVER